MSKEKQIVEEGELLMRSIGLDSASTNIFQHFQFRFIAVKRHLQHQDEEDGGKINSDPSR